MISRPMCLGAARVGARRDCAERLVMSQTLVLAGDLFISNLLEAVSCIQYAVGQLQESMTIIPHR